MSGKTARWKNDRDVLKLISGVPVNINVKNRDGSKPEIIGTIIKDTKQWEQWLKRQEVKDIGRRRKDTNRDY